MTKFKFKSKDWLIKKQLPHNFLAEKMILSCLLISSEAIEITLRTLEVKSFYFKNHQEIFKAIQTMYNNKMAVDIFTLYSFLQDKGLLNKVGGVQVLIELINQIPNLVYLEEYIRLVKDKFLRRCLIKLGYQAVNSGYITNISLEEILNDFENQLFKITNEIKTQKVITNTDILTNIFLQLKKKSLSPHFSGLTSGFKNLDFLTQGFQRSDLIIIAGRPSMGKTALSLNIAINTIKKYKIPILFFSLEMSREQILYRLLAMETSINQMRLRTGNICKEDWTNLSQKIKILSNLPFFIDDSSNLTIQNIRSKIKTILFEQSTIGLIFIDYLQLLEYSKLKMENRVQEIAQITRSLKSLAREFNIPVIALSQLSRNVENRINKRPILSDLRDSGSIEQDADLVIMLYREKYYNSGLDINAPQHLAELIIAKQRNGPTGIIKLKFNENCTKFTNIN